MNNLLEVKNISVSFDGFNAVNNLSFRIGYNEIKAVIGPNGAGKTTFMDIITGPVSYTHLTLPTKCSV